MGAKAPTIKERISLSTCEHSLDVLIHNFYILTFVFFFDILNLLHCGTHLNRNYGIEIIFRQFQEKQIFYPPVSEASRELANLTERKNTHTPAYGVKEFVCLLYF